MHSSIRLSHPENHRSHRFFSGHPALLTVLLGLAAALSVLICFPGSVRAQSALDGFDPNANGTVQVVVVQPDGKILIGGDFTTLSPNGGGPVTRNRIARLNPDGTLDTAFDPNASNEVDAIAVQADGKILVGRRFQRSEQHRRADAQPHRPARCHHRPG